MLSFSWVLAALAAASTLTGAGAFSASDLTAFPGAVTTAGAFTYATPGYDNRPHHTRTPFAVSSGNGSAFVAYPGPTSGTIYVQQVDPSKSFAAVGSAIAVPGILAGGLVAHDDGFALLTTRSDGTTSNGEPTTYLVRYTGSTESWATPLNGKQVTDGNWADTSSDVLDGDLAFNGETYGAYFVVHGASGETLGHYGDAIQYVDADGTRRANDASSTTWGCSHNEGIAIAPAAELPFLTLCSNDWQTGLYLNTDTRTMSGPKVSNDMATAGYAGEVFGGAQGSYSNVAQFSDGAALVAWSTHGASATADGGAGATMEVLTVTQRWDVHNVAVAPLTDKSTPLTTVSLTPGGSGDDNVKFLTTDTATDHVNVRTATYDDAGKLALVTYETVTAAKCTSLGTTCSGTYAGTTFQLVDATTGAVSGSSFSSTDVFVAGNIVTLANGCLAWPYVDAAWSLAEGASTSVTASKLSFATLCAGGNTTATAVPSASASASASSAVSSASASVTGSASASVSSASASAVSSASASSAPASSAPVSSSASASATVIASSSGSPSATASSAPASSFSASRPGASATPLPSASAPAHSHSAHPVSSFSASRPGATPSTTSRIAIATSVSDASASASGSASASASGSAGGDAPFPTGWWSGKHHHHYGYGAHRVVNSRRRK